MANGKPNTVDNRIHTRTWEVGSSDRLCIGLCELFAFVSLLVPATGILLGVCGLIATAGLWSIGLPAALGAIAGDWLAGLAPISWRGEVTREDFTVFEETTKQ